MIDKKIDTLNEHIVEQFNYIEKMTKKTLEGILEQNKKLLKEIKSVEENTINSNEVKIDKLCSTIFALYNLEAEDLRTVFMLSRTNSDLERIGDHCVNIVESGLNIIHTGILKKFKNIEVMGKKTIEMVKEIISAFINRDAKAAISVCKKDDTIDRLNEKIFNEVVKFISKNTKHVEDGLNVLRIANNFEKIADITTNISEEIIYIVEGKNIKHHRYDKK